MSIDAMKQALEALELWSPALGHALNKRAEAVVALRAAIEQAQEPVAWVGPSWLHPETRTWESESFAPGPIDGWTPLYTAPRQWQGLTEDEWKELWEKFDDRLDDLEEEFQASMIAKHGEGYYHVHPEDHWESQKQLIQRLVEAKLKEKNA